MATTLNMDGEAAPRFHVYVAGLHGEAVNCIAAYHTIEEVRTHRFRPDHRYMIYVDRKPMKSSEFWKWAATQE
jgi:hypothetical protein